MHKQTLPTLHQSLVELSNSNSVHYEVTAQAIRETRTAILAIEGVELPDISAKVKEIERLDAAIRAKSATLASLEVQVEKQLLAASAIYQQNFRHPLNRTNGASTN